MKPLSEVAPGLLVFQIQIQAVCLKEEISLQKFENYSFFSTGLEERPIHSADQILQAMREGEEIRKFGVTNMNDHSSRSHTIFRIIIESCMKVEGKKRCKFFYNFEKKNILLFIFDNF